MARTHAVESRPPKKRTVSKTRSECCKSFKLGDKIVNSRQLRGHITKVHENEGTYDVTYVDNQWDIDVPEKELKKCEYNI